MWRLLVDDHDIRIPRDMVLQMMHEIAQKAFVDAKLKGLLDIGIMPKAPTMFGM